MLVTRCGGYASPVAEGLVREVGRGLVRCYLICMWRRRILHQEEASFVNWVNNADVDSVAATTYFWNNLVAQLFDFRCTSSSRAESNAPSLDLPVLRFLVHAPHNQGRYAVFVRLVLGLSLSMSEPLIEVINTTFSRARVTATFKRRSPPGLFKGPKFIVICPCWSYP